MNEHDDARTEWLGAPNSDGAVRKPEADAPEHHDGEVDQAGSLGVPPQEAASAMALTAAESRLVQRDVEADEMEIAPDGGDGLVGIEKLLRWPVLRYLVILFSGVVLLIVLNQGMGLLSQIAAAPQWAQLPAYAGLGLLLLVILYAMLRLLLGFLRLRRTPRIATQTLKQLAARAQMRQQANQAFREARDALGDYLNDYPQPDARGHRRFDRLGFSSEQLDRLTQSRESLLSGQAANLSDEGWIQECEQRFITVLDEVADAKIASYATRVGLKTALAPTGFLDAAIVGINAWLMIGDLCRIYNLRTSNVGAFAILLRVSVNLLTASQLEEVTDTVWESASRAIGDGLPKALGGAVLKRAAEGAANTLLSRRLGHAAKRHLRPVR